MARISRQRIASYAAEQLAAGNKDVLREVAAYLIETKRTHEVELLVRDIERYLAIQGHVLGRVASAHELTEATEKAIRSLIKKETGATDIQLLTTRDEQLLGGIKLDLPGKQLDATIARTLAALKQ